MSPSDPHKTLFESVEGFAHVTAALAYRFADRAKVLARYRLDEPTLARARDVWRERMGAPGAESLRATFYAAYQERLDEEMGRLVVQDDADRAAGGARFLSEAQPFRREAAAVRVEAAAPLEEPFQPAPAPGELPSYLKQATLSKVKTVSTELPQPPPVLAPPVLSPPAVVRERMAEGATVALDEDDDPPDPRGSTVRMDQASVEPRGEPDQDDTMPIPLARQGLSSSPLPFGNRSTAEVRGAVAGHRPASSAGEPDRSGETLGLDDDSALLLSPREVPFDGTEDDSLTLEQFASCQAELGIWPDHAQPILAKYGLADEAKRRAVTRTWERRASKDSLLKARYADLLRELREDLSARKAKGFGPP